MHTVLWLPSGYASEVAHGALLLETARSEGAHLDAPCGGAGTCGKCRVRILSGETSPPDADELVALTGRELREGVRLACRCRILGDVTLSKGEVRLEIPDILAAGATAAFDLDVELASTGPAFGLAVDIGTTTVAAGLIDMRTGDELAAATAINPQTTIGHDVLTRVRYAAEPPHLAELAGLIRACVDGLIDEVCGASGAGRASIAEVVVAGNTAMTHLLLGTDVRGLGRAPYTPLDPAPLPVPASELGWSIGPEAQVACVPAVSAFVGGDVVAGLIAVGLPDDEGAALLVDMGTNGELVLCTGDGLWGCSCAAGPAFEGMGISCGMRAAAGAIDCVRFADDAFEITTIGGRTAAGLCGSGVIDAAASLAEAGVVQLSGRFVRDAAGAGWAASLRDDPRRFVLTGEGETEVAFSQGDVRQVQLAKGAIATGISALLDAAGIDEEAVDRLLIAGQFGHHVRKSSLVAIGLVPFALRDRVEVVGNTSKSGAIKCLLSRAERGRAATVARDVRHVELSTLPGFDRLLARNMAFPDAAPAASI